MISIYEFENHCDRQKVAITQGELLRIYKIYGELDGAGDDEPLMNYRKISHQLGLHKGSYDFFNQVNSGNQVANIKKIR